MRDPRNERHNRNERFRQGGSPADGTARRTASQQANRPDYSEASARMSYERFLELAKEALRAGDRVEMENCFQHAEHHLRMMRYPDQR